MEYPDRGRQISINRQLISRGFADEAEENFLSKVTNVQLNLVIQGYLHTIKHCYQTFLSKEPCRWCNGSR